MFVADRLVSDLQESRREKFGGRIRTVPQRIQIVIIQSGIESTMRMRDGFEIQLFLKLMKIVWPTVRPSGSGAEK